MENFNGKAALKVLHTIHWSIVMMPLIFGAVVFLQNDGRLTFFDNSEPLIYIPIVFLGIAIPLSTYVFNYSVRSNMPLPMAPLSTKLTKFQTAHLLKLSILEIVAFMAVVVCLVTNTLFNLVILGIAGGFMAIITPTARRITEVMGLTREEALQMNN